VTDEQDLYGLPLDRFVPERGTLAKALRKDGQRERAAEISSLRKPSVAAWAVNQLVRTRGGEVAALFDAGDALQHAQSQLLAGRGDGNALREAAVRERDAVGELAELARGLLSSAGHDLTPTMLDRVSETLHAAAFDEQARAQVKDGCLARELRHIGLGQGGVASHPGASRPTKPAREPDAARRAEAKRAERERAELLKAARKTEASAERAAERAERDLDTAQTRRDQMADSLREAEEALAAAHKVLERAKLEHARASKELGRLEG
jgi:hypothetical protein